jgi:hypothetical protein
MDVKTITLEITSPAFAAGAMIPHPFTCEGANHSPPLAWGTAPHGTRAFALIVDDPDAPGGTWVHWIAWDIPGDSTGLHEHVKPTDRPPTQGINSFGKPGYGGPCPPPGHGAHRYYFRLYALDQPLGLGPTATRAELDAAMRAHVLARAELMGKYRRER